MVSPRATSPAMEYSTVSSYSRSQTWTYATQVPIKITVRVRQSRSVI